MPNVPSMYVKVKKNTLRNAHTSAKKLFTLPGNSVILRFMVSVTTAFDGGGTNLVDIGSLDNDDAYAADIDVSSADQIVVEDQLLGFVSTKPFDIYATYTDGDSDSSEGEATIYVVYADPFNS